VASNTDDAKQAGAKPVLNIPSSPESWETMAARFMGLVGSAGTHFYIDTSFLMWMTKIGLAPRSELLRWLKENAPGRTHVPIWSAHEYARHHVDETIIKDLGERISKLGRFVDSTYADFRPFVDASNQAGGEVEAETVLAKTRSAVLQLSDLVRFSRSWHSMYPKHAAEVIEFINLHALGSPQLYEYFRDIQTLGAGRFMGRIPPGFQDRNKKSRTLEENGGETTETVGSNRYGDLIFWKEVLDHAHTQKVQSIVILTNDRKNDWRFGGASGPVSPGAKKPASQTHPMLSLEANIASGVGAVILLDNVYFVSAIAAKFADETRALADLVLVAELDARKATIAAHEESLAKKKQEEASARGYRFADAPSLDASQTKLRRALYESRAALPAELLGFFGSQPATALNLRERLTHSALESYGENDLVSIARELHDHVLRGDPGYRDALSDLVTELRELPPKTASCFYLGLLASMYLERGSNAPKLPPVSPIAAQLFDHQQQPFADVPVQVLSSRMQKQLRMPLYVPDSAAPEIDVTFSFEPGAPLANQLRMIRALGSDLIVLAQPDETLRLKAIFGPTIGTEPLLRKASELFGLPLAQLRIDHPQDVYNLTDTIGFKRPIDVFRVKE